MNAPWHKLHMGPSTKWLICGTGYAHVPKELQLSNLLLQTKKIVYMIQYASLS